VYSNYYIIRLYAQACINKLVNWECLALRKKGSWKGFLLEPRGLVTDRLPALFGTDRFALRWHRSHVPNQVLAAGYGGRIALVRPLLLIFFVSFSICCCPFSIRWRQQRFNVDVALVP
jgi:hypothetical protein